MISEKSTNSLLQNVTVLRHSQAPQTLTISWTPHPSLKYVDIFTSSIPDKNSKDRLYLARVEDHSITITDPYLHHRSYLILQTDQGSSILTSERRLPLTGATNFRDLGGYRSKDGRTLKWNQFYRSDELCHLTDQDKWYLQQFGIKFIVDFRSDQERSKKPNQELVGVENLHTSVFTKQEEKRNGMSLDLFSFFRFRKMMDQLKSPIRFMKRLYCDMVTNKPAFHQLIQLISSPHQVPIVFHCTVGKDRTGFASALLLFTLGIPEETVMEDYLLTNQFIETKEQQLMKRYAPFLQSDRAKEILKTIMEAKQEYLQAAIQVIKEKHGTIEKYLEEEYGLDERKRSQLQDTYLEAYY